MNVDVSILNTTMVKPATLTWPSALILSGQAQAQLHCHIR